MNTTDRMTRSGKRIPVGIVGGGPAGLVTAIELGRRGVPCVLFEEDPTPPWFPKANASTARTMEHYRRLGFAADIRSVGLPLDYPQDVAYFTRYSAWELARLKGLTRREALASAGRDYPGWPTPEPVHRANQILIEPVLKRQAERWPCVDVRFGWRVTALAADATDEGADCVTLVAEELTTGRRETLAFDYVAGCDGPRSMVRRALAIQHEGVSDEERTFMGGTMFAARLKAPAFFDISAGKPAWQNWAFNPERRAILSAIDGLGEFTFHTQLPRGVEGTREWVEQSLALTLKCEMPYEILDMAPWTAGLTLVAERFFAGRIFLAGDAAHLFTPVGGLGYNTSVEDGVNLGWKLAAVCNGWGGPDLLRSYEDERRPAAQRNTQFARHMANRMGEIVVTPEHEARTPEGAQLRRQLGARLQQHAEDEFNTPGIQFGAWYAGSKVVVHDGETPLEDPHRYRPNACPGARAPHAWLDASRCLYDEFGMDFTLLQLNPAADVAPLADAAGKLGIPLKVLALANDRVRDLYGRDLAIVRPDHHVAWRGDRLPQDPRALLCRIAGRNP